MSAQLLVSHLSYSYPTSPIDVLIDVCLSFSPGWYGVVGQNGCGKTTLLRILAGELAVDPAVLVRYPAELAVRYCPQSVHQLTPEIVRFSERRDGDALRLVGQLELEPNDLTRWSSLSPGERKRWQIGAALADLPDLTLLDEPTNHLDSRTKRLLFDRLDGFRGIGVIVSHDRALLDSLTSSTVKIGTAGNVAMYSGNYSKARGLWAGDEKRVLEERERLQAERRKLKRRLDSARRSREKAESGKSTAKRMKGIRDTDARSMATKGRVAAAEQKLGREVELLRRRLYNAEENVKGVRVEKEVGRSVFVLEDTAPTRNLISLNRSVVKRGNKTLIRDVDVTIRRDSRVHLMGVNGSGKTTLIAALLEESRLPRERVLYLPQDLSSDLIEKNKNELESMLGPEKGRLLQIVAALGVPPERILASDRPSPGEARKLAVAMGLSRQAWLLMLDEPTNHLDLPSIERLEGALVRYSCALLVVSHDERFASAVTRESWRIERQQLVKV